MSANMVPCMAHLVEKRKKNIAHCRLPLLLMDI